VKGCVDHDSGVGSAVCRGLTRPWCPVVELVGGAGWSWHGQATGLIGVVVAWEPMLVLFAKQEHSDGQVNALNTAQQEKIPKSRVPEQYHSR